MRFASSSGLDRSPGFVPAEGGCRRCRSRPSRRSRGGDEKGRWGETRRLQSLTTSGTSDGPGAGCGKPEAESLRRSERGGSRRHQEPTPWSGARRPLSAPWGIPSLELRVRRSILYLVSRIWPHRFTTMANLVTLSATQPLARLSAAQRPHRDPSNRHSSLANAASIRTTVTLMATFRALQQGVALTLLLQLPCSCYSMLAVSLSSVPQMVARSPRKIPIKRNHHLRGCS